MADDTLTSDPDSIVAALERHLAGSQEPERDDDEPEVSAPVPDPEPNSPQAAPDNDQAAETATPEADTAQADAPVTTAQTPEPKAVTPSYADSPEYKAAIAEATRERDQATAARTQLLTAYETLVPQLEARLRGEFADIKSYDDALQVAKTDPDRYNAWVIYQGELQQKQQELRSLQEADAKTKANERATAFKSEQQKLTQLVPEFADPVKGPVLAEKLQAYAIAQGHTKERLSNWTAADFVGLHKAMQFDNLEKAAALAKEKAKGAPPVQTPGTVRQTNGKEEKYKADYERLQKTGHINDVASILQHMI